MTQQVITSVEQLPQVDPAVAAQRNLIADTLAKNGLLGIGGGCALTEERAIVRSEGNQLVELQDAQEGLATAHRMNVYKDRSPVAPGQPEPYRGLETVDPDTAREMVDEEASRHGNVAMEVALPHHVEYIDKSAVVWGGARNNDMELLKRLARRDPRVLFLMKNRTDGNLEPTLDFLSSINREREDVAERLGILVAPALLVYRGDDTAKSPAAWRDSRMAAYEATEGQMIDDVAHGSMRAHHPRGAYEKSIIGQLMAWESLMILAKSGYMSLGVMGEGSATRADVDPHTPFRTLIQNIKTVNNIKTAQSAAIAV